MSTTESPPPAAAVAPTVGEDESPLAASKSSKSGLDESPDQAPLPPTNETNDESLVTLHPPPAHTTKSPKPPLSPTRRVSKRIKKRRQSRPIPKIFQDSISVIIPLDVTVDLKVAIEHTRNKRIRSIYKRFPALKKIVKKWKHSHELENGEDLIDEDDASTKDPNLDGKENNKPSKKKKKVLAHVPQPEQYGSVIDYLEAKYVRGVMLGDDEVEGESMNDGSEGQGSVYSAGSFLDDTDLQRDVAEQVMANTTLTKLELEDEDGEFFVNVGALEVEENQYGDNYDPIQDNETSKTIKKRKKSTTSEAAATENAESSSQKNKKTKEDSLAQSSKSKKSIASPGTQKTKSVKKPDEVEAAPTATATEAEGEETEEHEALVAKVKKTKSRSDALFKKLTALVKSMTPDELPRRKTKLKVSLTCPPNKKPGDDVTFTNPHNKGQRLRVKVPKDCLPGGTFKVSVPVKQDPADADGDDKDHNTFSREFQESMDDYARAHDDWCSAQAAVDKNFALFKEKQAKFDPVVALFPTNLMTPVTVEYMKKIIRRARQNRHKRKKNAALKGDSSTKGEDDDEEGIDESDKEETGEQNDEDQEDEIGAPEVKKRIVEIPTMGSKFPKVKFSEADFGN